MKYSKKYHLNASISRSHSYTHPWMTYKPSSGAFCATSKENQTFTPKGWYYCREMFARTISRFKKNNNNYIIIYHPVNKGRNIAKFFNELEKRLKIWPRTEINGFKNYKNWNGNISLVKVSPWWLENGIRKQLLTIFLRCGIDYKSSFDKVIKNNKYLKQTPKAIKKFLNGYTKCNVKTGGWVTSFKEYKPFYSYYSWNGYKKLTKKEIDKKLSKLVK